MIFFLSCEIRKLKMKTIFSKDFPATGRGMAAKEKLKAGAVIIETPSTVFLNTL